MARELHEELRAAGFDVVGADVVEKAPSNCAGLIFTAPDFAKAQTLNAICLESNTPFIWASQSGRGVLSVFCDAGRETVARNPNGFCRLDSRLVRVANVESGLVITTDCEHGLDEEDVVGIGESVLRVGVVASETQFRAEAVNDVGLIHINDVIRLKRRRQRNENDDYVSNAADNCDVLSLSELLSPAL